MKRTNYLFIVLTISLLTIHLVTYSQGCLPEGITFTTQEEIDNFQTNYPGCTEIEGDVEIRGYLISNLNGLNLITSIGGSLLIGEEYYSSNSLLVDLNGLTNLTSIGGELRINRNENLEDISALVNLTYIGGDLWIGSSSLSDLTGLNNLTTLNGGLRINHNDNLINFNGLQNLSSIQDDLWVNYNISLTSLTGLNNLTSVGGNLKIGENDELVSLSLLANLSYVGGLLIGGDELLSLEGLENIISIPGNVIVGVSSFEGLNNVTTIGGNFSIGYKVTDLSALSNLASIGGDFGFSYSDSITNFSGLDNLTYIGENFEIYANEALVNFSGLENLTHIGGSLYIGRYFFDQYYQVWKAGNPLLTDLTGLNNLETVNEKIHIYCNDLLSSLSALENLTYAGGIVIGDYQFSVSCGNPSLINLEGLENISPEGINEIDIRYNESLSSCTAQSICYFLMSPNGTVNISNNAPGCNSPEEVEEACFVNTNQIADQGNKIRIFPNPAKDEISVTCSENIHIKEFCIFNQTGKKLIYHKGSEKTIDISEMQPGLYFVVIKTDIGDYREKLIIK